MIGGLIGVKYERNSITPSMYKAKLVTKGFSYRVLILVRFLPHVKVSPIIELH